MHASGIVLQIPVQIAVYINNDDETLLPPQGNRCANQEPENGRNEERYEERKTTAIESKMLYFIIKS